MRKLFILLVLLMTVCTTVFAEPGEKKEARRARKDSIKVAEMVGAHRKGTKIKLDGIVLTPEQQTLLLSNIDSLDFNPEWAAYKKQRHLGNGLAIGGSVLVGAGAAAEVVALGYVMVGVLVAALTLGQADMNEILKPAGYWATGGLVAAGVGAGVMAVGIPIRVKADKNMKVICEGYNNATVRVESSVIFGTTASGIGLSFNF
ncbi:MAG: hypothetical protein IKZ60_06335 [Bacteroidales bacterium]|nr:hypothetical protein [Bacteroidales bacterium]